MLVQKFIPPEVNSKVKSIFRKTIGTIGTLVLALLAGVLAGYLSGHILKNEGFRHKVETTVRELAAVPAPFILKLYVVIAALLFFAIRGYFPKIYGGIEIAVGLLAIFYAADKIPEAVPEALPLLTGIYIIIRGLDNIAKNLKRDKWTIEVSNLLFNQPTLTEAEKQAFRTKRMLKYTEKGA